MKATIRSNVVPVDISLPQPPESPRAFAELYQLIICEKPIVNLFIICFIAAGALRGVQVVLFRRVCPIDKLDFVTIDCCDSGIVPNTVVFNLGNQDVSMAFPEVSCAIFSKDSTYLDLLTNLRRMREYL